MKSTHVYLLRFRRRGWQQAAHYHYLDERAARRHLRKVLSTDRPDLAPVVEWRLTRRPLGDLEVLGSREVTE